MFRPTRANGQPVESAKDLLISSMKDHQALIVAGQIGSGKSSHVPLYIARDGGYGGRGKTVLCSQTWSVDAVSSALAIDRRLHCNLGGQEVGYSIPESEGHSECARSSTVRYMPESMFLGEVIDWHGDIPEEYSVVIVDDAQDRTVYTDLILGFLILSLKLGRRPDLRVVVMTLSETTDESVIKLWTFFIKGCSCKAKIIVILNLLRSVEVIYTDPAGTGGDENRKMSTSSDHIGAALSTVFDIHKSRKPVLRTEDILLFLADRREVETACKRINDSIYGSELVVLPMYNGTWYEDETRLSEIKSWYHQCRSVEVVSVFLPLTRCFRFKS